MVMPGRSFRILLACGLLCLVASDVVAEKLQSGIVATSKASPGSLPITGEYWALIIGINTYKNVPPLDTAVKDATGVRNVLVERYGFRPDHMTELLNERATRTNIEDALFKLGRQAEAQDSVFIYYAGHGQYDEDGRLGWWVPVEAQPQKPGTFITNASIRDYVESMKAKHVYLVADSCFSGTLFGKARAMPPLDDQFFARLYSKKSRWALTSGGTEPVADQGKDGHSIFAYHFITLLKENTSPYLVPSHIFDQLAPVIANNAEQMPRSEPMKGTGDEGGQFVFRLAATGGSRQATVQQGTPDDVAQLRKDLEALKSQMKSSADDKRSMPDGGTRPAETPGGGQGEMKPEGGTSQQQAKAQQGMALLLERARKASQDQWPEQKKRMLGHQEDRMKESNPTNPEAIAKALATIGQILENAREMAESTFQSQKDQMVRKMKQALRSGMGNQAGTGAATGTVGAASP